MRDKSNPHGPASSQPGGFERLPHGPHKLPREMVEDNQRRRILAAVPEVLVEHGYARASVRHIIERSGVSRRTFYEHFENKEEVFRAAYDAAFDRLHAQLMRECRAQAHWPEQVRAAIVAALRLAAADPPTARLLVVEPFAAGPEATAHHHRCLGRFASGLRPGREQSAGPAPLPPLTEQGLVYGICGVIAERLLSGAAAGLPGLAPQLTELTLTPYLGAQQARLVALGRPRPRFVDFDAGGNDRGAANS